MPEYVVVLSFKTYSDSVQESLESYIAEKFAAEMKTPSEKVMAIRIS